MCNRVIHGLPPNYSRNTYNNTIGSPPEIFGSRRSRRSRKEKIYMSDTSCKLFGTVFSHFLLKFTNKTSDLLQYDETDPFVTSNSVSSWKTRNPPNPTGYDHLIKFIRGYVEIISPESFCGMDIFIAEMGEIFALYNLEGEWNTAVETYSNYGELIAESVALGYRYRRKTPSTQIVCSNDKSKRGHRRLIVFNPDGTLIRGAEEPWRLLFEIAEAPTERYEESKKAFLDGDISYLQWMRGNVAALKEAGLTKDAIQNAVRSRCTLAENFHAAIKKLVDASFIPGIISGIPDVILYTMIPQIEADFKIGNTSNIYTNRLIFDNKSREITDIDITPYDWSDEYRGIAGKSQGLLRMCSENGVSLDGTVFIGNGISDFDAMSLAGNSMLDLDTFTSTLSLGSVVTFPKAIPYKGNDLTVLADAVLVALQNNV